MNSKITMRVGLENLLHGWWREQGAKLTYAGRREAGIIGRRNETVRLTYPDGFWIEFEFAADDGMPARISMSENTRTARLRKSNQPPKKNRIAKLITLTASALPSSSITIATKFRPAASPMTPSNTTNP